MQQDRSLVVFMTTCVLFLFAEAAGAGALQDPAQETSSATPPVAAVVDDELSNPAADRPIKDFLPNLLRDTIGLVSKPSAATLLVGGTAAVVVHSADERVKQWVAASGLTSYTKVGNELGSAWIETAAALSTYGAGRLWHYPTVAHVGSDLIRAQTLNSIIVVGTKFASDRTRPNGKRYSLPSFHSGATFASAAVLHRHFGWKTGIPAYGTAAFVGWTRIRDQAHWVSDVVLGATIGTIAGVTVTRGHRESRWQITPVASAHSFSVQIVRQ